MQTAKLIRPKYINKDEKIFGIRIHTLIIEQELTDTRGVYMMLVCVEQTFPTHIPALLQLPGNGLKTQAC